MVEVDISPIAVLKNKITFTQARARKDSEDGCGQVYTYLRLNIVFVTLKTPMYSLRRANYSTKCQLCSQGVKDVIGQNSEKKHAICPTEYLPWNYWDVRRLWEQPNITPQGDLPQRFPGATNSNGTRE